MLVGRLLGAALTAVLIALCGMTSGHADDTTVVCTATGCRLVAVADAVYLGLLTPPPPASGSGSGSPAAPVCTYQNADAGMSESRFFRMSGGHTMAEGSMYLKICNDGSGNPTTTWTFVATDAGNPVAVIDPAVVTRDAIAQLAELSALVPDTHLMPDQLSVNRYTYLWVTDPGAVSATAAAGTVSVTATATLTSVTWSMGEPVDGATFTCQGAGRDPGPAANTTMVDDPESGTCHYAFHLRSLDERTGGSGSWQVTAQANWAVTWQSNTGETGTDTLQVASVTPASVGEWRTVIVPVDPNCCR